jgi:hypothetical protein
VKWQLAVVLVVACGPSHNNGGDDALGGPDAFAGPYPDFPSTPIVDTGTPADVPGLFGDPMTGAPNGGPCLVEPEVGTLYPNNWLRPRFTWIATGTENVFELRLTAANQINPLIVYTNATSWTMPGTIWDALAAHTVDQPITVSVRGATYSSGALVSGPEHGTAGDIAIAPVPAPGAIVYWTTSAGTVLRGFRVGDETVKDIIHPADVAGSACVGCHSSTPDGVFVGFSSSPAAGNGDPATLGMQSVDGMHTAPPFITASAQTLMARQQQELPTYSKLHWQPGDHVALTMFNSGIMWTDLEATSTAQGAGWDMLPRGDANGAAYASFAHTADTVLYVSAPTVSSGVTVTQGDIATVPFNNRLGGTATKVLGADTSAYNEYYPTFSPDDKYVAYNRVAQNQSSYNNSQAEVFAILATGGTPIRLFANDPPACSGRVSPGVTNSWPKWSPEATDSGGKRYYWLTFSSTRSAGNNPQLYVTPLVDTAGLVTTYPALYLWNQPAGENNHTPAWDNFGILQ